MSDHTHLVPAHLRAAEHLARPGSLLRRVLSHTARVRLEEVIDLDRIVDEQPPFRAKLEALGFEVVGATSEMRYPVAGMRVERLWFRYPEDPVITASISDSKRKESFYFWAAFDDGKLLGMSNTPVLLEGAHDFAPERDHVWFPAGDDIEASFAFFREAVDHHRAWRTPLLFEEPEDCVALLRFSRTRMTRREVGAQVGAFSALLFVVLTLGWALTLAGLLVALLLV